jgi:hypothetical protein
MDLKYWLKVSSPSAAYGIGVFDERRHRYECQETATAGGILSWRVKPDNAWRRRGINSETRPSIDRTYAQVARVT